MTQSPIENITAVEISTAIVDEIVDEIFIPWEVYQAIYYLSRSHLSRLAVDSSLWNRYLQLRRQLELAYCLLLIDPNSAQYNRLLVEEVKRDLPLLSQHADWEIISTRLPEPIPERRRSMSQVNELLRSPEFVDVLQQLNKHKIALDRRDRLLRNSSCQSNITDTTYAQTSLQLNGKIVNRYSQAILERSDRNLLLQLHEQSTNAGEQQWRGLVKFMLSIISHRSRM